MMVWMAAILGRWFGDEAFEVDHIASAGFSGASTWAVRCGARAYVLKSFVASASMYRAGWVHALMRHCRAAGSPEVPEVFPGIDGRTAQAGPDGTIWELLERMPGAAISRPPCDQAAAAGALLARLHRSAATLPGSTPVHGVPGSLQRRIEAARTLLAHPWATRNPASAPAGIGARVARAADLIATSSGARALATMASATPMVLSLQPVLRDPWSDHLLFQDGSIKGMIDWHAAGIDAPAADIARLLGSWHVSPPVTGALLDAYRAVRPIDSRSLALIPFLQATGIVLGLDNWFRWTLEEGRRFPDMGRVEERIDALLAALPTAVDMLGDMISPRAWTTG